MSGNINPRTPTKIGGGAKPLPGQGPSFPVGPQRGHWSLKETLGPTVCRFLGVLWISRPLGKILTSPLLTQPTDVVAGLTRENPPIPVRLRPGIRHKDVQNDRHPIPKKLRIQPLSPPDMIATTDYLMPHGISKGNTSLTTSARDGTKDPSGYDASGAEEDRETHTTTYLCN